jgi:hypothetical protein
VREHLDRHGLGLPLEGNRSARDVVGAVVANQGGFLRGDPDVAVGVIADTIVKMRQHQLTLKRREREVIADELLASSRILSAQTASAEQLLQNEVLRLRAELDSLKSKNDEQLT